MPALTPGDLGKLARTLAHLQPMQFAYRARLRLVRRALKSQPARFAQRWTGDTNQSMAWPTAFSTIDSVVAGVAPDSAKQAQRNAAGIFQFVGETHHLGTPANWRPSDRTQLFRYNLHYFDWSMNFTASPDRAWARTAFASLWTSWSAGTTFGRWDEWSPYVVSLRAWNLCATFDALVRDTPVEDDVRRSLSLHAGFLRANLERDVGGNHIIKNLKALVGLGVFLGDETLVDDAVRHLRRQIALQVLADGGHFERSPAYHAQVLADLIDCDGLLRASGHPDAEVADAVMRMRQWLAEMLLPDGDIPLFGDAWLLGDRFVAALALPASSSERLVHLAPSGYVVARPTSGTTLIADVGAPCPRELPAHGSAGCLSFVLSVHGERVIVDTGTSAYVGARRAYERSTAAHNTLVIDGLDQSEVWGSFRVGRRARPSVHQVTEDGTDLVIEASHDGYRHVKGRPIHRRRWNISTRSIVIVDTVTGAGRHHVEGRLVLAAGLSADARDQGLSVADRVVVSEVPGTSAPWHLEPAAVAAEFGRLIPTSSATWAETVELPFIRTTDLQLPLATGSVSYVGASPADVAERL